MQEHTGPAILAVNVGNTHTRFGIAEGEHITGTWTATTPAHLTCDEALAQARVVLGELFAGEKPHGTVLSCVVPEHARAWTAALGALSETRPVVVGPGVKTGIRMRQNDPSEVGADRVANAVGAAHLVGTPAVAVSLGTATTIEVVDKTGAYAGGIIAPGIDLGCRALAAAGAQLSAVDLHKPPHAVGANTADAIRSGIVLGEAARVAGLLGAVMEELGYDAPVVLTGGRADLIAPLLGREVTRCDDLTLRGLALIWPRNRS